MTSSVIIGGGASGTIAALRIKSLNKDTKVTVLERSSQLLKKLQATGNGRCNLSNSNIPEYFHVAGFLNSLGIFTREEEEGRIYPFSGRAKDVTESLKEALDSFNVKVELNFSVSEVKPLNKGFVIKSEEGVTVEADTVILALGGKASPQLGATGDGYKIAKALGIGLSPLYPGLTHFIVKDYDLNLVGIRVKGKASLFFKGNLVAEEKGEIQFSKNGISGIAVMNLSSLTTLKDGDKIEDYSLVIDIMEEFNEEAVLNILKDRASIKYLKVKDFLLTVTPYELGKAVIKRAGIKDYSLKEPVASLREEELINISKELKGMKFSVQGLGGYKDAQITVGGILESEVNIDTCESKKYKGLYIIGELLDYQGPCGGYNLHHAFSTGIKAANHIAEGAKGGI